MQKYFSEKRLLKYKPDNNYEEYFKNIKASMELYPLLHVFEIVLRNKIDTFIGENFGAEWLKDILENTVGTMKITENIEDKIYEAYNRAYSEELKRSDVTHKYPIINALIPVIHDDILSNLTLGFWVNFFNIKIINLSGINISDFMEYILNQKNARKSDLELAHKELVDIRKFRNRISHFERIYNHPAYSHLKYHELLRKYLKKLEFNKGELKEICARCS